jgi:bacterioferritin
MLKTAQHDIGDILRESLEHERVALVAHCDLLRFVENHSVLLEVYARELIVIEERHQDEVNKMLRRPGDTAAFQA